MHLPSATVMFSMASYAALVWALSPPTAPSSQSPLRRGYASPSMRILNLVSYRECRAFSRAVLSSRGRIVTRDEPLHTESE